MGLKREFVYGVLYGLMLALAATGVLLVAARRPVGEPVVLAEAPTPAPVRVYVQGAVATPGVYALPPGSIVQDALTAAGGPRAAADLSALNLAQALNDGDRVVVVQPTHTPTPRPTATPLPPTVTVGPGTPTPTPYPTATASPARPVTGETGGGGGLININTATAAELDRLPRIGPSIAQRIVEYREANGPFTKVEDLMRVKGIGPATFEQLRDLITVGT